METVCQVAFNLMTRSEAARAESVLREYLLRVCDQVILQRMGSSAFSLFFSVSSPKNLKRVLKPEDLAQEGDRDWTLNLTENVKNIINQTTLLFHGGPLKGFTDPKFTKKGNEIAYLFLKEKLLTLYIPDTDKAEISDRGVYLDSSFEDTIEA